MNVRVTIMLTDSYLHVKSYVVRHDRHLLHRLLKVAFARVVVTLVGSHRRLEYHTVATAEGVGKSNDRLRRERFCCDDV